MNRPIEFHKLIAASFTSQTGSHFLTLALAAFIFVKTGSPILSGLVFVLSFLPSIVVGSRLGHWVDRSVSRTLIARNELISILASVLCGLCIHLELHLSVLCLVLSLRSMLMFIGRAAATKWLKVISPPALQTERVKVFYLGFFLSTAVSGVLAAAVLSHASIWSIVVVDAATYLIGILIYCSLRPIADQAPGSLPSLEEKRGDVPSLRETLSTIFAMPAIRTSFLLVCFTQAVFQGAYSVLVSYLPIRSFGLGVAGVGSFQVAASIGITVGFFINWRAAHIFAERQPRIPVRALLVSSAALLFLLACVYAPTSAFSLIAFTVLNLAYECVWLHHSSEFFRGSPKDHAARYQFTLSSCAAFLMSLATLSYSAAIQFLGAGAGTVTVLLAGLFLFAMVGAVTSRSARMPSFGEEPV